MTTKPSDGATLTRGVVSDWREVQPGRTYSTADVAALFSWSVETANRKLKAGLIAPLPRLTRTEPFRVLGSELLRLLGEQGLHLSGPSESVAERTARNEAAKRRVHAVAGGRAAAK